MEAKPQRAWLKRLVGGALLLGVASALVLARCESSQRGHALGRERGLIALHLALSGEAEAFERAQQELALAAGAVIYDARPLFELEVVKALQGEVSGLSPEAEPVLTALKKQHYQEALSLAAALDARLSFREPLVELCAEMVRLSQRAPSSSL